MRGVRVISNIVIPFGLFAFLQSRILIRPRRAKKRKPTIEFICCFNLFVVENDVPFFLSILNKC